MAGWVGVLAAEPDNLSLMPRAHVVGSCKLSPDIYMHAGAHTLTHAQRFKNDVVFDLCYSRHYKY